METQHKTMSHSHAVDFTGRLCIPGPTKESCTQHPHTDALNTVYGSLAGALCVSAGLKKNNWSDKTL